MNTWQLALRNVEGITSWKHRTCGYRHCNAALVISEGRNQRRFCNDECKKLECALMHADRVREKRNAN